MKRILPSLRDRFSQVGAAYLVLIICLIPTGVAYYLVDGFVRARDEGRFSLAVRGTQDLIERRLASYIDTLRTLRSLPDPGGVIEASEWQGYFSSFNFKKRFPGLAAIGFTELVPAGQRSEHEARMRHAGVAGYQITGATNGGEFFPAVFVEPVGDAQLRMVGLDFASIPQCRLAMEKAKNADLPVGAGPLDPPLLTTSAKEREMMVFLPVYRGMKVQIPADRRRSALTGYLFVVFAMDDMVREALGKEAVSGLMVEIFDLHPVAKNLLYQNEQPVTDADARFKTTGRINFTGRTWSVRFSTGSLFEEDSLSYLPPIMLVGGLGFSFALFGIALVQTRARVAAEQFTEDLRQAQMRYRLIERATNDAIWDWDIGSGRVVWNESMQAMFIYAEDKIGATIEWWKERVDPDDLQRILAGRDSALQTGGEFWADEYRFQRGDGSYADVIDRGYIVRAKDGTALRMIGSMVDITGRKLAEEARRRSEQRLTLHVQQTPLAVIEWNLQFEVTEWNPSAERVFGYTAEEVVGKQGLELIVPPNTRDQVSKVWYDLLTQTAEVLSDGKPAFRGRSSVNENNTKDRRIIICEWYNTPLIDRNGQVIGVASLALDVTASKRAEQALAAEKERLAVTLRSIGDGVITTDINGKITSINKIAEGLTGWDHGEAVGRPLASVFRIVHQKTLEILEFPIRRLLETGQMVALSHNTALLARNGSRRNIDSSGAPIRDKESHIIGAVLVFRDMTEQQAMADELLRAGKLESLGILAGGIAHDFNNILTAITGNVSLVKMHTNRADKTFARLEEAEKAAMRARDLTQQLLTFAKGGAPVRKTASINELVKDSTEFAMRGANVRCEFSLVEGLLPVDVDEGQISQVINNLAINAIQAMPEGGIIHVATENMTMSPEQGLPLPLGTYVKISIHDHGTGIRPEHLSKIFDPYFTTKQKGSGLGLATSYSIIKKHDGLITVESELGAGTVFHIYLPASEKPVSLISSVDDVPLRGHGRILVMDDEPLILELATAALAELGYEVETVTDGAEAVRLYGQRMTEGRGFSVVIMDLTIPGGMGGKEAMKRLLALDADVKGIVSSGYSNDPVMAHYAQFGFKGFVCKPYRVEDLARAVNSILEPVG